MKIIFAGTSKISEIILNKILKIPYFCQIIGVLTNPDKRSGRGRKIIFSPVKTLALKYKIPIWQPELLNSQELHILINKKSPDLILVISYGKVFPENILNIPTIGCWNIHFSCLPKWRGSSPVQRAIENGDKETAVTIINMDKGLDTGDILSFKKIKISSYDTTISLSNKLAILGGNLLINTLFLQKKNQLYPKKQSTHGISYAKKIQKLESIIDWSQNAKYIIRKIRAFQPWPICYAPLSGCNIKIWDADIIYNKSGKPAKILQVNKEGVQVACGKYSINITKIQIPGKKISNIKTIFSTVKKTFIPETFWK